MSNTAENIQLLLADILSFHEDLEKVFAMEKGIHDHAFWSQLCMHRFKHFVAKTFTRMFIPKPPGCVSVLLKTTHFAMVTSAQQYTPLSSI